MSGSRSYSTSDASEQPERDEVLSLQTVQKMLPLVQRIAKDIVAQHREILHLQPEENRLDRQKRQLDWPMRQRRYRVKEELAGLDNAKQGAVTELQELGLALLDESFGLIGFPTLVNDRRAYFTWHPGQESLQHWQFVDDETPRPIPPSWFKEVSMSASS